VDAAKLAGVGSAAPQLALRVRAAPAAALRCAACALAPLGLRSRARAAPPQLHTREGPRGGWRRTDNLPNDDRRAQRACYLSQHTPADATHSSCSRSLAPRRSLTLAEPGALALCRDYAAEGRQRRVVDFDDHLDDLSRRVFAFAFAFGCCVCVCARVDDRHADAGLRRRDWLNPELFS
jgi:hypothetical protein